MDGGSPDAPWEILQKYSEVPCCGQGLGGAAAKLVGVVCVRRVLLASCHSPTTREPWGGGCQGPGMGSPSSGQPAWAECGEVSCGLHL